MILALETSCDDTCAAVLDGDRLLSNVVSSQGVHDRYGGVVPEIASRHHLELVNTVVDDALAQADATLDDVDLVALTQGPGLIGALLIGIATGKALAAARGLPIAPVDHLQGHIAANYLGGFEPPFLCLVASGGHTLLARVDRARRLRDPRRHPGRRRGGGLRQGRAHARPRLPGRAGAVEARGGRRPDRVRVPHLAQGRGSRLLLRGRQDGAALRAARPRRRPAPRADLAASFEHAIVQALIERIEQAIAQTGLRRVAIGGGVAANRLLRERVEALGVEVHVPPRELCTDNAAMIASAARYVEPVAFPQYLALDAYATGQRVA